MKPLTDNPITSIEEDEFGFLPFARTLASLIIDSDLKKLPLCIGIFGEWGTGKSSLMTMIRQLIGESNGIKTIWFNPWKYDKKEELWKALIQTILSEMSQNQDTKPSKAKEFAKNTSWFFFKKALSVSSMGTISEENIEQLRNDIFKGDESYYRHINYFEKDFADIVNDYTEGGKLVIFIDDLDRCLPENAITVLESLKLFIGNAQCIFVVGMDHTIIEEGINLRFGNRTKLSGKDYLDKIIQIPFFLPPVSFETLYQSLKKVETQINSNNIWRLIELGFKSNPRKVKRFVNSFCLIDSIIKNPLLAPTEDVEDSLNPPKEPLYIAKLLVIQMVFTDFYLYLKEYPEAWQDLYLQVIARPGMNQDYLKEHVRLKKIWEENEQFKEFMQKSSKIFHEPPDKQGVRKLLQVITLVTSESEYN